MLLEGGNTDTGYEKKIFFFGGPGYHRQHEQENSTYFWMTEGDT